GLPPPLDGRRRESPASIQEETEIMTPVAAAPKTETRPTWAPDAASARRAAERAMRAASVAREWAERAGAGQPEAADAARAAERAWDAAMRSRVATDPAE